MPRESVPTIVYILNTLAPVFLLIGLGAILTWRSFLSPSFLKELNNLVYWIGLPSLLFIRIATAETDFVTTGRLFLLVSFATVSTLAVSALGSRFLRLTAQSAGTFQQAAIRGNLTFIGLPVIIYAFAGVGPAYDNHVVTMAILAMAPIMVFNNTLSVLALLKGQGELGGRFLGQTFKRIFLNPFVISCLGGILYAALGPPIPLSIVRSFEIVGQMALPLALLCIGGSLVTVPLHGSIRNATFASLLKVAVTPLAGWFLAPWFGLNGEEIKVALIFLACPTAAASYVLAVSMKGDEGLASSAIVLSTLLSLVSLGVVVGFF